METRETSSNRVAAMADPAKEPARRPASQRILFLAITATAVLLTWWARWYLHFTNYAGLVVSQDLQVLRVLSDGPAAGSAIEPGDRVAAIDGSPIANLTDYLKVMQDPRLKGRKVAVGLRRAGADLAVPLTVTSYPVIHATSFGPICGLLLLGFGLYVHARKPKDPAAGLYLLLSVCLFVLLALSNHLLRQMPSPVLFLLWGTALIAAAPLNLHFYLVFPEPKALVRSKPSLLAALYIVPAIFIVLLASIVAGLEWDLWRGLDSGPGFNRLRYLFLAYFVLGLLSCPAFIASLLHSFLRAPSAERRRQVQVVLTGAIATLLFAGLAVSGLILYLTHPQAAALWPPWTFDTLYGVTVLATVILPLSMAVAILKYRLWDLDRTLHGTLNCMLLSVVLLGLGLVILGVLGWAFGEVVRPSSHLPLIVFTLTVAALVDPLRHFVERTIDRTLNPGAHAYRKTLRAFSRELVTIRRLEPLAARLCEKVSAALGAKRAAVVLRGEPGEWRLVASVGVNEDEKPRLVEASRTIERLSGADLSQAASLRLREEPALEESARKTGMEIGVPIVHEGRFLGCLLIGLKAGDWPYTVDDRQLLETLANQLAVAAVNAEAFEKIENLNRDLQSRNRELEEKSAKLEEQRSEILRLQEKILGENRTLKEQLRGEVDFSSIVGAAHGLKSVMERVEKVAPSDATVLVLGETGTGKELIARAIHSNSQRAQGPFIAVNTATLPEGLLQSELFGHEKGAFTGASERRPGRFELAEGGTIFLDEIGDIPVATQLALLRVLQERKFERVGGRQTIEVNVRVIAATNRDLERAVQEGRFRSDLYYRLKVVTIQVPPLRDRTEDIRELALHFLQKHARKHGKSITALDEEVVERLKAYRWPGNVREMENVIEHAVVLSRGDVLGIEDVPLELRAADAPADAQAPLRTEDGTSSPHADGSSPTRRGHREDLDEIEREKLKDALARAGGNRSEAARLAGLPRTTFFDKAKKHRLLEG